MMCHYLVLKIFVNSKLISVVLAAITSLLLIVPSKLPSDPEKVCFAFLIFISCSLEIILWFKDDG